MVSKSIRYINNRFIWIVIITHNQIIIYCIINIGKNRTCDFMLILKDFSIFSLVSIKDEIDRAIHNVINETAFIKGKYVQQFEIEYAEAHGLKHCISCANGTDALYLALKALDIGPGDEVITPPNSFIASTAAIVHTGARPVLVDVCEDQNINPDLIEASITNNTKAIMPVHLTGRMARMDAILEISNKYDILIIEDAAHAIGATVNGIFAGNIGDIAHLTAFQLHEIANTHFLR